MAGLLRWEAGTLGWHAGQPHHDETRKDESEETCHQSLPVSMPDKKKSNEDNAHAQQRTAEEPECRSRGQNALAHCPPKAAEENDPEQKAGKQGERQNRKVTHLCPPFHPAWPCLPWRPSATHSNSQSQ